MKRRWRILLVAWACAVLAIASALVWPGEREPVYKGKKLSAWIDGAGRTPPPADQVERIEAVRHIGTNAVPDLLKWIEGSEFPRSAGKLDMAAIKVMNRATARSWLGYRYRKFYRAVDASWAFEVLGSDAGSAVPELVRLSRSTNNAIAGLAWGPLARLEDNGTPEVRDRIRAAIYPPPRDYTNSPGTTAPGESGPFTVGHVWRTNSKVQVPPGPEASNLNSHASGKLQ